MNCYSHNTFSLSLSLLLSFSQASFVCLRNSFDEKKNGCTAACYLISSTSLTFSSIYLKRAINKVFFSFSRLSTTVRSIVYWYMCDIIWNGSRFISYSTHMNSVRYRWWLHDILFLLILFLVPSHYSFGSSNIFTVISHLVRMNLFNFLLIIVCCRLPCHDNNLSFKIIMFWRVTTHKNHWHWLFNCITHVNVLRIHYDWWWNAWNQ